MSARWVYDHYTELGGFKIGGTIFFTEEGLIDAIQRGQAVARNSKIQRKKAPNQTVSNKVSRLRVGTKEKEGSEESREGLAERAGLTEFL